MWLIAVAVGVAAGLISGLGIGGGTILVLYLTAILDVDPAAAAAINLVYFFGCAPSSLWFHAKGGLIDRRAALLCAVGGAATALIASLLAPASSPDWLRRLFGALLLTVGVRELWLCFHSEKKSG